MLKKEQAVLSLHSSAGKDELHGTYKTGENKYRLAASVKECMKTASVDKITVKNIVEGCGLTRRHFTGIFWINTT